MLTVSILGCPWAQYGFTFAGEAADGEMALPLIQKTKPDILITDIKMPFLDGLDLIRLVSREFPHMKVIILSGYDDFNYARQAIRLAVEQYLLKPVTKATMLAALEAVRKKIEEEREQNDYLRKFQQETQEYEQYSRRNFFERMVSGTLPVTALYEQAEALGIDLKAPGYNIVLFTLQAAAAHPNWVIAGQLHGEFTQAKAYEVTSEYLRSRRDLDVVYCENDNMAFGVMQALDEAGLSYGVDGDVILISFDAARRALESCLDGKINLCMECNPLQGPRVAELIQALERGETVPRESYVPETFFTPDTLTPERIAERAY